MSPGKIAKHGDGPGSVNLDSCDKSNIWTLNLMSVRKSKTLTSCCNTSLTWKKIHMSLFLSWTTAWKSSVTLTVHKNQNSTLMSCKDWTALQTKSRLNVCLVFRSFLRIPCLQMQSAWAHVLCALGERKRTKLAMQSGYSLIMKPCSHRLPPTLPPGFFQFVSCFERTSRDSDACNFLQSWQSFTRSTRW